MGRIYLARNKVNGKGYVGRESQEIGSRQTDHIKHASNGCQFIFHRALRKYGFDAFEWITLCECEEHELNDKEKFYIAELQTMAPNGYNMTAGGEGTVGYSHTEETKRKIAEKAKGRKVSGLTRLKLSVAGTDKKRSPAAVLNMKASQSRPEIRAKISKATKGKSKSEATKAKHRANWQNPEWRAKMLEARKASKPIQAAKVKVKSKEMWQDPEMRAKIIAAQKAARKRKGAQQRLELS